MLSEEWLSGLLCIVEVNVLQDPGKDKTVLVGLEILRRSQDSAGRTAPRMGAGNGVKF